MALGKRLAIVQIKKTNQEWDSIPHEAKAPDKRSFQDFWTRLKGI